MNLQIFSFAYNFLISPPIFELLPLSMVSTYRDVTPHFGNLRGRIFTHIMIAIINSTGCPKIKLALGYLTIVSTSDSQEHLRGPNRF